MREGMGSECIIRQINGFSYGVTMVNGILLFWNNYIMV
jgi:hypothetical protein